MIHNDGPNNLTPEEDLSSIYSSEPSAPPLAATCTRRSFQPWHHPVKQLVRDRQWAELTRRLVSERGEVTNVIHYFTLPGLDLLDVRVLAGVCEPLGIKIRYFGFDSRSQVADEPATAPTRDAPWIPAESALRQAGKISADALILPDRLEDIAISRSQAAEQLRRQAGFDIINIDACDHLAYCSKGRSVSIFDALRALLEHQMARLRTPWLLFLTTRVEPGLAGLPFLTFTKAITENLQLSPQDFGSALAEAIDADVSKIATALAEISTKHDPAFLKLYTIGLGKFLLHFFHAQPNLPATVELTSAYCYRVRHDQPDMLSVAFRIVPDQPRVFPPSAGGAASIPTLESSRAVQIARRARKLWDLDSAMQDGVVRGAAVKRTAELLASANYDLSAWKHWLAEHPTRPMTEVEV